MRWLGFAVDWCMLAKGGLYVEAVYLPSHLVNTFGMGINTHYFVSVERPYHKYMCIYFCEVNFHM